MPPAGPLFHDRKSTACLGQLRKSTAEGSLGRNRPDPQSPTPPGPRVRRRLAPRPARACGARGTRGAEELTAALGTEPDRHAKETWQSFAGAFRCSRRPATSWWATRGRCLASASAAEPPPGNRAKETLFSLPSPPPFPQRQLPFTKCFKKKKGGGISGAPSSNPPRPTSV